MLTVPEAARRVGRNPETVRRWIREGRLRASKVGTQHVIQEDDLTAALADDEDEMLPIPKEWAKTFWGGPMPNVVAALRRAREGH
jgi:excisionase family DNA binding protein